MNSTAEVSKENGLRELVTFYVGEALCGIDILNVQEINKLRKWTPVPHSDEHILGILSLRGNIVTIFDLGRKLGTRPTVAGEKSRNIIVNVDNECTGLSVDSIGDVVSVDNSRISEPPANVNGIQSGFLEGVFKTESKLIAILNVEAIIGNNED